LNWLDWVFILIVVFSALKGLSTGFFAGVAKIISLILGITVAFIGYRPLAVYLEREWGWGDSIAELLLKHFSTSSLQDIANKIFINKLQQDFLHRQNQQLSEGLHSIVNHLTTTILEFLAFMLLLIMVVLVVGMIMGLFSGAITHTFLSPIDYFGGLLLGLVRGVIIVVVITLLLEPVIVTGLSDSQVEGGFITQAANRSLIVPHTLQLLKILNFHVPIAGLSYLKLLVLMDVNIYKQVIINI